MRRSFPALNPLLGLVLGTGLCLAAEGPGMQAAAQGAPASGKLAPGVVELACTDAAGGDAAQAAAVCAALATEIAATLARAPGWSLHRAPAPGARLRITLVLTRADARAVAGHLAWSAPPGGPPTVGPSVTTGALDAPLSPSAYPDFARGLLKVSDLPF